MHSECVLEYSGTFWNILDVVEGCRKVDFQVGDLQILIFDAIDTIHFGHAHAPLRAFFDKLIDMA